MNTKYPVEFTERMQRLLGDEYSAFINCMEEPSPTSVRLNPRKIVSKFNTEEKITWCDHGRYLAERPSFTFDPLFHAGTYYVQEASSMFIEQAWKFVNPGNATVRVLDMCAAPGGKSTHLLSLMNDESLLVTNEIIPNRNKILQQNIIKWGSSNCIITQNKPESFGAVENYFDIVLIDAPCSGEGLFRKDKDAVDEWSERNVAMCAERQKDILKHALACLKPGGYIIYSTCTYEPAENDNHIDELGINGFIFADEKQWPGIVKTKHGYQFFPHRIKGEGFYITILQKEGSNKIQSGNTKTVIGQPSSLLSQYLEQPGNFIEIQRNGLAFAISNSVFSDFIYLEKKLYIRNAGLFAGTLKGKDFLPSHDLALSNNIKKDLPFIDVSYGDAITFLRSETFKVNTEKRGWCLVKYEGQNLGWIKVLDGRINNYFPKDWRILRPLPATPPTKGTG